MRRGDLRLGDQDEDRRRAFGLDLGLIASSFWPAHQQYPDLHWLIVLARLGASHSRNTLIAVVEDRRSRQQ